MAPAGCRRGRCGHVPGGRLALVRTARNFFRVTFASYGGFDFSVLARRCGRQIIFNHHERRCCLAKRHGSGWSFNWSNALPGCWRNRLRRRSIGISSCFTVVIRRRNRRRGRAGGNVQTGWRRNPGAGRFNRFGERGCFVRCGNGWRGLNFQIPFKINRAVKGNRTRQWLENGRQPWLDTSFRRDRPRHEMTQVIAH